MISAPDGLVASAVIMVEAVAAAEAEVEEGAMVVVADGLGGWMMYGLRSVEAVSDGGTKRLIPKARCMKFATFSKAACRGHSVRGFFFAFKSVRALSN